MALKKSVVLPSRAVGEYWRIVSFRWDRNAREMSALIDVFTSEADAKAGAKPLRETVLKLRLSGAQFDEWVPPAVMLAPLYRAARVVPLVGDPGAEVLADAVEV